MNKLTLLPRYLKFFVLVLLGLLWSHHWQPTAAATGAGPIIITEFMADNATTLADSDGAFSDWIELHNPTAAPINLDGWYLTDNASLLTKWRIPAVTLNPGAYLVVFASSKNRTAPELHTNFALSKGGEYLALVQPDGVTVGWHYTPTFPPQYTDISYGVDANGYERFYTVPTPGGPNDVPAANQSPVVLSLDQTPTTPRTVDAILFQATAVASPTAVNGVTLHYSVAGSGITNTLALLDDGLSGDGAAGDTVYGGTLAAGTFAANDVVNYWVVAENTAAAPTRYPFAATAYQQFTVLPSGTQTLFVNEFMASNSFTYLGRGAYTADVNDFEDWLELYNPNGAAVDISGYTLTNDLTNPTLWTAPAGTIIPANGYLLLWAMGVDATTPNSTNFKLDTSGGAVGLYDTGGVLVDAIIYGPQLTDVSYGRATDGSNTLAFFGQATAAASNNTAEALPTATNIAPKPDFSLAAGFYPTVQSLSLSSGVAGAQIWYTTDGSIPQPGVAGSSLYTGTPLAVNSTAVVRARTFATGYLPSGPKTRTFFINFSNPAGLPIVSYSLNQEYWSGDNMISISVAGTNGVPKSNCESYSPRNYFQEWERPIALEIFDETGSRAVNMDAGIRMFGNCSRSLSPKSTSLRPRDRYGDDTLSYPFFANRAVSDYPILLLRNSGQDNTRSLMRDGFAQSLLVGYMENVDYQSYAPSIVFRNGVYEGILNFREKMDERYVELYHGYTADQLEMVDRVRYGPATPVLEARLGTLDAFNALMNYVKNNDMTDPTVYISTTQQIDVDAYMNYYIAQVYYANTDWPSNNVRMWRSVPDGQWRWMLFDTESGFRNSAVNTNNLTRATTSAAGPEWSYIIFQRMMVNQTFREEFAQRYAAHLDITFDPTRVIGLLDTAAARIEPEVPRHLAKWGYPANWANEIQDMRNFANGRPATQFTHMAGFDGADQINTTSNLNIITTPAGGGQLFVHDVPVPTADFTGRFFNTIPLRLEAAANPGYRFIGWQRAGFPDDPTAAITITLSANDVITAVFEAVAPVIVTEIHYNPSVGQGADQEFVELYNADVNPLDLNGYAFSAGMGHTFTVSTVIPANGYLLLAHPNATYNPATLGCTVVKWTSGRLDNAGEAITIQNGAADVVDTVTYDDAAPWPIEPDGLGYSVGLYDVALDNGTAANWRASALPNGGTPCQPNVSQITAVADTVGPVPLASTGTTFTTLLANDQAAFVGDTLTITAVGTPSNGGAIASFTASTVTYDAPAVASSDSFTYTVQSAATGQTATALVTVQINPATPGGVSTSLVYWLRADVGTNTTVNGANVTSWADQSGNNNNATNLTAPTFAADALNFNPLLAFAGGNMGMTIANSTAINTTAQTAKSQCVVFRTGADVTTRQMVYEQGGQTNGLNFYVVGGQFYANLWVSNANNFGSVAITADTPYVACAVYQGGSFFRAYLNGVQFLNDTAVPASLSAHTGAVGIGQVQNDTRYHTAGLAGAGDYFTGQIGELIQYNQTLSNGDRQRIESYLAVKYGLTLPEGAYRDTASTLLYNLASHNQDIAGIGLDGLTALDQPQSRSANADGMVTISGSPMAQQFLLWGNDGGAGLNTADLPPNYAERLNRTWAVVGTGLATADSLTFDVTGWGVSGTTLADFALVVDTDTTFANAPRLIPAEGVAGNLVSFSAVSLSTGEYFTLVTAAEVDTDGDGVSDRLECPSGNPLTQTGCDNADGAGAIDMLDPLTICGLGSLPTGQLWTFATAHPLLLTIQSRGTLECVQVAETAGVHPQGTTNGAAVTNNWWYTIHSYNMARVQSAPNGSFSATLTMPTSFTTTADSKLCRYTAGPGAGWDCAGGPVAPALVERSGLTGFSDWSAGQGVGPTAVTMQGVKTAAPQSLVWLALVAALLLVATAVPFGRHARAA